MDYDLLSLLSIFLFWNEVIFRNVEKHALRAHMEGSTNFPNVSILPSHSTVIQIRKLTSTILLLAKVWILFEFYWFFSSCPFSLLGSHVGFISQISLVSPNLWQFFSLSMFFVTETCKGYWLLFYRMSLHLDLSCDWVVILHFWQKWHRIHMCAHWPSSWGHDVRVFYYDWF